MRGCDHDYGSRDKSLIVRRCSTALAKFGTLRTCILSLGCFLLLPGCQSLRSRFGIEPDTVPAPPPVASVPAGGKPAQSSSVVQTGGTVRAEMPALPIDIPRDPGPKTQGPASSPGSLTTSVESTREAAPKTPAFPTPGQAPADLPAAFDLSNDSAPKPQPPGAPMQGPGGPTRENSGERIAELAHAALARYQTIDSYIARFRRREVVGSSSKPEELMLIKFRKNPWSVYFKWLGTEGHGREAAFVEGKYDNKLNTLLAAGDVPLMPAGKRFSISPDSSLVRNASRHSIRDAGFGTLINQFAKLAEANAQGDTRMGALRYLGPIKRPEFDQPCVAVEQTIPPGSEPGMSKGGRRLWVFDSATSLPVLVTAHDDANKELEYYCYDRIQYPANLTDDDFNPDVLWRPKH